MLGSFPSDFPDGCPFPDAQEAKGVVFRIAKSNEPKAEEFLTHFEQDKMKNACPCLRRGLSVMLSVKDVFHQQSILPFLGKYILWAELSAEDGKTALTKGKVPSHTTWWPYEGVNRHSKFTIFEQADSNYV